MTKKDMKKALGATLKAEESAVKNRFEKAKSVREENQTEPESEQKGESSNLAEVVSRIKKRCLKAGINVTESEVIRAAVAALDAVGDCSVENIESALKSAGPLIGQACVIGDRRPYNVALLVLDPETGLDPRNPEVLERVQSEVDAANSRLSRVEQIKRFALLDEEWLPGGDELTPTMKLKRKPIAEKYAPEIDALYG